MIWTKKQKSGGNIQLLSRIGFTVLIVSLFVSYSVQTYFYSQIKEIERKIAVIGKVHESLQETVYRTELLLTSYDVDVKRIDYVTAFYRFEKEMALFVGYFPDEESLFRNYKFVVAKHNDLLRVLESGVFSAESQQYKPLLVRLGELNRTENKSAYFITLKTFFETTQHLKQYQEFLYEDLGELMEKISTGHKEEIHLFNMLSTILPLGVMLFALLFSLMIDRFISTKESVLLNTKNLLRNIIDSIPIRIFWKDRDGVYLGANRLFVQDARLDSVEELVGKSDFQLPWSATEAQKYSDDDQQVMQSGVAKLNIMETQTKEEGKRLYLNTSKVPLFGEDGRVAGIVGLYEDVTPKVMSDEKIKQQEMQLVQQNRLAQMGEMISMIAHQWRQPLTAIGLTSSGLIYRLDKHRFDRDLFKDKLSRINEQTDHLSETIEDFRNFFKPDKQMSKVSVEDLVNDTFKIVSPTLEKSDISFHTVFACNKEIVTFPNEFKQVLLNIIKNAQDAFAERSIKDPFIRISVTHSDGDRCLFMIEDNAGGIPEKLLGRIFDPYFSTKLEKNGTGLGLYMSKMIIEDHCKGSLTVRSSEGRTLFTITV